jgi:hypothetical protein
MIHHVSFHCRPAHHDRMGVRRIALWNVADFNLLRAGPELFSVYRRAVLIVAPAATSKVSRYRPANREKSQTP